MRLPFSRLFVLALCSAAAHAEIFDYDVGTTEGKCTKAQLMKIDELIDDCNALVEAAMWAIEQHSQGQASAGVLTLFTSYFGIEWDWNIEGGFADAVSADAWSNIIYTFQEIQVFLQGADLSPYASSDPSQKPYIFCGEGNYERWDWYDEALDQDMEPIPKARLYGGGYYTVKEMYGAEFTEQNVFYSLKDKGYLFSNGDGCQPYVNSEGVTSVSVAFTSRPVKARTNPSEPQTVLPPSLTLCPATLDAPSNNEPALLSDITYPTPEAPVALDSMVTQSASMFHELAHLTTDYVVDYWYPLNVVIANAVYSSDQGGTLASRNAESYMYFALAVWFYKNAPSGTTPATFYRGMSNDPIRIPDN
ncbi:hypothetical protein UA08_08368 [Talaromyces atroroseus]|uniref:Lysine-specific metallo-endopeptidase domain-containing protein n=1 Tax=Talaromyces atroroseus TaxID=1441469 RepID=A0A1Q5Q7L3_TALAT|nr:hypothetical protein UA08_08368 [Talaromyces atroroseus]OKL56215.1 hypothetical protein UA08_08368 [Talaromyces atroroseus]